MTRFGDDPVASTVSIPPRRQPRRDTSTRNRRDFKLNVTDPDLLIPIKQTAVNKRHSDLREPQPSPSDSQPASSQPVSETTTSESSVSLPSSPSGSSCTASTSTSGTDSSSSETSSESSSQPSSNASSPETSSSASTSRSTSPELLEMERSFNSLLAGTRDRQSHPVTRSQMDKLERPTATYRRAEASCQSAAEPTAARLSASSSKHATSPRIPEDVQVTRGLRARCRQRMPMLLVRAVTQRTDYRTFKKSLVDALDHPVSRNWPNSSRLHQMKREQPCQQQGRDERSSLSRRGRRRVKNKHCNLTLKTKDGPVRTVLCFPEMSL